ncbi:MAG TPA: class II aldolase/adducin family protein [Vicinamibacterales bacterium]|jgi:L-fuculose-phosphate aldolase
MEPMDLTAYGVIAMKDVDTAVREGATEILTRERVVLTPSAREAVLRHGIVLRAVDHDASSGVRARRTRSGAPAGAATDAAVPTVLPAAPAELSTRPPVSRAVRDLFNSPEAVAIKDEIVTTGQKLWRRQFVDGNGGNISYRLGPNEVICTPTLLSKADLRPEDLCLVDLDGNELIGIRARTSEIFLHLAIYKAQPKAKAVVHCHPPHATAYAVIGRVPPSAVIPEFDVFVGRVAYAPYETPGTKKFAQTVLPFVQNYNTVLLGNHGIVCWADTVTHAEWYAEVLETYCWTLTIASQLGVPFSRIPAEKEADLLELKQRLGLPDPRFNPEACRLREMAAEEPGAIVVAPPPGCVYDERPPDEMDLDAIVRDVTEAVVTILERRGFKT